MVYVLINAAIAAFLIRLSFNVNFKTLNGNENSLINIVLLASFTAAMMAVATFLILWEYERLAIFFEHVILLAVAVLFLFSSCFFTSCAFKKNAVIKFFEAALFLCAAYVSIAKITVTDYAKMTFSSEKIFSQAISEFLPVTWLHFYYGLFIFAIPAFSILLLTLFAENKNSRLLFQRSMFFAGTIFLSWLGFAAISFLSKMLPMFVSLYTLTVAVTMAFLVSASRQDKIFDTFSLASDFFFGLIKYAVPAFAGAVVFVALRPLCESAPVPYFAVVFAATVFAALASRYLVRVAANLTSFRSSKYDALFEADLASINYDDETLDICSHFFSIFKNRVNLEEMKILIAGGNNELNTVFSSDSSRPTLSTKDAGLEAVRAEGISVLLKDEIDNSFALQMKEAEILSFFNALKAEAIIILNEGRHLVGILALGKKRGGSSYDEYDKNAFDKLYSYFFVFGYYMSNIANASVVGTVNREVKMSAQIIKSIQENMDFLSNPKIDVGYLMVPAHNIGGEFVDLIRLNERRHIFVVGAMSGKGISASMNMVILKSIIRTLVATTKDFKKFVSRVNEFIRFGLPKGTFFAGVFCMVDFETDTMYYVNCGIPAMLLYTRAFNNVIEIQGNGFVLGFAKNVTPLLRVKQMKLHPGDVLSIVTEGVISSHSLRGDQYGKDNIKKSMTENYMYDGMHMAEFLFDDLKRFMAKELDEDITVLMMRYLDKDTQTVTNVEEDEGKEAEEQAAIA